MPKPIDLLVVSSAVHYAHQGTLFGYGPYVREMNLWAELFEEMVIAAPCRYEPPPADYLPFASSRVSISPVTEVGGEHLVAKIKSVFALPKIVAELSSVMSRADAIHVRCPGNLGLVGVLLAPLFSKPRVAKYAGQWDRYRGEAWTYALQRWLLGSRWWGAPVTVYGSYSRQPTHVISFFTSILDDFQMDRARVAANARPSRAHERLRVLYVGRLSRAKNVDVLIQAVSTLREEGLPIECTIVGDGPEAPALSQLAAVVSASGTIRFAGALEHNSVLSHYENSDVLVLASDTEGWPKSIAEAMAFGLICIGSDRGFVRQMLGGGRGLIVPPRDVTGLAAHLRDIALNPGEFAHVSRAAADWSQQFSLSGLREALRELLGTKWGGNAPRVQKREILSRSEIVA